MNVLRRLIVGSVALCMPENSYSYAHLSVSTLGRCRRAVAGRHYCALARESRRQAMFRERALARVHHPARSAAPLLSSRHQSSSTYASIRAVPVTRSRARLRESRLEHSPSEWGTLVPQLSDGLGVGGGQILGPVVARTGIRWNSGILHHTAASSRSDGQRVGLRCRALNWAPQ